MSVERLQEYERRSRKRKRTRTPKEVKTGGKVPTRDVTKEGEKKSPKLRGHTRRRGRKDSRLPSFPCRCCPAHTPASLGEIGTRRKTADLSCQPHLVHSNLGAGRQDKRGTRLSLKKRRFCKTMDSEQSLLALLVSVLSSFSTLHIPSLFPVGHSNLFAPFLFCNSPQNDDLLVSCPPRSEPVLPSSLSADVKALQRGPKERTISSSTTVTHLDTPQWSASQP